MTVTAKDGKEYAIVEGKDGKAKYFVQPTTLEMSEWQQAFGAEIAAIMKANYYSHSKNGFVFEGKKQRVIRDFEGKVLEVLAQKEEVSTTSVKQPAIEYTSILELLKVPNIPVDATIILEKMLTSIIPEVVMQMPIEILEYVVKLRKTV